MPALFPAQLSQVAEEFSNATDLELQGFFLQWEVESCWAEAEAGQVNAQNCGCCPLPKKQVPKDPLRRTGANGQGSPYFTPHQVPVAELTVRVHGNNREKPQPLVGVGLPAVQHPDSAAMKHAYCSSNCPQFPSLGNQTITGGSE